MGKKAISDLKRLGVEPSKYGNGIISALPSRMKSQPCQKRGSAMSKKTTPPNSVLILGSSGFIGHHLASRMESMGYNVTGVDLHPSKYFNPKIFVKTDLNDMRMVDLVISQRQYEWIFQLAENLGGTKNILSGASDNAILINAIKMNMQIIQSLTSKHFKGKVFFSSSSAVYRDKTNLTEPSAYPANPDTEYGWAKLVCERLYKSAGRNYGLKVRIGRLHNVYGEEDNLSPERIKSMTALCLQILGSGKNKPVEIWGDGKQVRSYTHVEDTINGILALMNSDCAMPMNLSSTEAMTINELAKKIADVAGIKINIKHLDCKAGCSYRVPENTLAYEMLRWKPRIPLERGIWKTLEWLKGTSK
jgi:nucleoside-diphosphate-sugar epimerase